MLKVTMDWYDILLVAREVAQKGELTSLALGSEIKTGLPEKKKERATAIASAWLSKFYRWGYALPIGSHSADGKGKRWIRVYKLTRWGERMRPKRRKKQR